MLSRLQLAKGSCYRLEGPASIKMVGGLLKVLGKPVKPKEALMVPRSKSIPIEVVEDSTVEVRLGPEASFEPLPSPPIPREWISAAERILEAGRPIKVLVLGDVDSGKALFCTFLVNKLIEAGLKVGILDCDPGQAEVFVPTTIALGLAQRFVAGIDEASLLASYFIGSTSPSGLIDRMLAGVASLMERASRLEVEALIVNTSGWILGREARTLGWGLLNLVRPSHVVLIQRGVEVEHLVKPYLHKVLRVPTSPLVRSRSREDRRVRRELAFRDYFAKAKVRKFSLDAVGLMYTLLSTGFRMSEGRMMEVEKVVGRRVVYGEEGPDSLFVVVEGPPPSMEGAVAALKERFNKEEVLITYSGAERGLIVGLMDQDHNMLGLGLIRELNYEDRTISVSTPVEGAVSLIQVGQLKLSEDCREVARLNGWPL
jgi:polynucleotide 5'-hydroxyl-kinase GRC3/NOL9